MNLNPVTGTVAGIALDPDIAAESSGYRSGIIKIAASLVQPLPVVLRSSGLEQLPLFAQRHAGSGKGDDKGDSMTSSRQMFRLNFQVGFSLVDIQETVFADLVKQMSQKQGVAVKVPWDLAADL